MPGPSVALVVPTLDEEVTIRRNLPAALAAADELVVSDGGSSDGTVGAARDLGARVVTGGPGRGPQLNRGAAATTADVLLFLHADSVLTRPAVEQVRSAVLRGAVGGGFLVAFDQPGRLFRLGSALVNLRTRATRAPLGDQGQFATRQAFSAVGGFVDWPILEDLDFIRRLKRHGRIELLDARIQTSARRYLAGGVARTIAINWLIWTLFSLGVSPHRLARLYRAVR